MLDALLVPDRKVWVADPFGFAPRQMTVPVGCAVEKMIDYALTVGGFPAGTRDLVRVHIDGLEIDPTFWADCVPAAGAMVSLTVAPGKGGGAGKILGTIAMIAVVALSAWVAGGALAGTWLAQATGYSFAAGSSSAMIAAMGVSLVGGVLVQAAFGGADKTSTRYTIDGVGNTPLEKFKPVPVLFGRRRIYPRLAATTWTECHDIDADGDNYVYLNMLVFWSVGRVAYTDLKIGETPISEYDDYEIQDHLSPADEFPTLYGRVVREDTISTELRRSFGWVQRRTRVNTTKIGVTLGWPSGLYGKNYRSSFGVDLEMQYRAVGSDTWLDAPSGGSFTVKKKTKKVFYKNYAWAVDKGQYDVRIRRTNNDDWDLDEDDQGLRQTTAYWVRMHSYGDGLPILHADNFSFTALRFRATNQVNGTIDKLNAIVTSVVPKWNGAKFDESSYGESRNPAELFHWYVASSVTALPQGGAVGTAALGAWAEECTANGWNCDYVAESGSMDATMRVLAAAGQGFGPVWEDGLLSVAVDDLKSAAVQIFSARNVRNFRGNIAFPDEIHAVNVAFADSSSNYDTQTRTVYATGYDATTATKFETVELPYKCDPAEAYVFGWRYLAARTLRPETYTFETWTEGLVVRYGKRADVAHWRMSVGIQGSRIRALVLNSDAQVAGVQLDDAVTMEAGKNYALRVQRGSAVGTFELTTAAGTSDTLTLATPVAQTGFGVVGNPAIFGIAGAETLPAIVVGIDVKNDKTATLTCIPYAPGMLENGGTIPDWNPLVTSRQTSKPSTGGRALSPADQDAVNDNALSDALANTADTAGNVDDLQLQTDDLSSTLKKSITLVDAVPTEKESSIVYNETTGQLYKWSDAEGKYVALVTAVDEITSSQIADAAITTAKFAAGIEPVTVVSAVPAIKSTYQIFCTADGKSYRWNGAAYVATVAAADIAGTLAAAQIASVAASQVSGQLSDSQIAAVSAAKVSGQLVSSQIADAAITTAKFAAGIEPVTVVSAVPAIKSTYQIFCTADGKSYRWNGAAYVATVAATDIAGTLAAAQIASVAASQVTGQIVGTQITDGAIGTAKLAAGSVTASQIAAGTIQASNIASATITGANIAANTITGSNIAADTITAGNIAAGAISASELAAGAVTASKLYVGDAQNMVLNPTSEDTSFTSGYGASGVYNAGSDAHSGSYVRRSVTVGTEEVSNIFYFGPAVAGEYFYYSLYMRHFSGDGRAFWYWLAYNSSNSVVGYGGSLSANTDWTNFSGIIGPMPAGTSTLRFYGGHNSGAGVSYHDDIILRKASTGSLIVDGSITATKIAASTITGSNIAAGTITTDNLAANCVTTAKLTAGSVTASQIAAGTILACNIASATITGGNIAASTITGSNIAADTISAGNIAAGAISASELAAGAVTASKVAVGDFTNLCTNGRFMDASGNPSTEGWVGSISARAYSTSAWNPWISTACIADISARDTEFGNWFAVRGGETYAFYAICVNDTGHTCNLGFHLYCNGASNWVSAVSIPAGLNGTVSGQLTVPSDGQALIWAQIDAFGDFGLLRLSNVIVRKAASAELLVDGSITALKIAANTITGSNIAAGTITADNLAANSITTGKVAAGAIGVDQLAAGAVTADKIAAGAISADVITTGTLNVDTIIQTGAISTVGYKRFQSGDTDFGGMYVSDLPDPTETLVSLTKDKRWVVAFSDISDSGSYQDTFPTQYFANIVGYLGNSTTDLKVFVAYGNSYSTDSGGHKYLSGPTISAQTHLQWQTSDAYGCVVPAYIPPGYKYVEVVMRSDNATLQLYRVDASYIRLKK